METLITMFLGIFGAMVGSYKVVRSIRKDDSRPQELILWLVFVGVSLIVLFAGCYYGFIPVGVE